jgi:hypothetical protein
MTSHTYLILIRDGRLALAVGAALEDRLLRDGHEALALVPAVRGLEFADAGYLRRLRTGQAGPGQPSQAPQVVALYEDGLLKRLESLGLAAYIGVPHEEEWRIVHWDNDIGAMLLPVATARDLVDAVAHHTPWSRGAQKVSNAASPHGRDGRWALGAPPALSRKLAVASAVGVAGSLLLVSVPPAAAAPSGIQASGRPGAVSGATVATVETAFETSQAAANGASGSGPGPGSGNGTTTSSGSSFSSTIQSIAGQVGTGVQNAASAVSSAFQRSMEIQGQAELTNAEANLALGNAVLDRMPAIGAGIKFGGGRGFVYGTTVGTIGGAIVGGGLGLLAGGVGVIPGAIAGAGTWGGVGFWGGVTGGAIIGGVYGGVTNQAPDFGPAEARTFELADNYGFILGTAGGTVTAISRGVGNIGKIGKIADLGLYLGVTSLSLGGALASLLGYPSSGTTPSGTTPPGSVPQGPSSLPQGFRNQFGLGPDGQILGQNPGSFDNANPPQGAAPPGQDNTAPSQGATPPAQDNTAPSQGATPPAQDNTAPSQGATPPAQNNGTPPQDTTPPAQNNGTPPQDVTPPAQNNATPPGPLGQGNGSSSSQGTTTPASAPGDTTPPVATNPSGGTTTPPPAVDTTTPVATNPSGGTTTPAPAIDTTVPVATNSSGGTTTTLPPAVDTTVPVATTSSIPTVTPVGFTPSTGGTTTPIITTPPPIMTPSTGGITIPIIPTPPPIISTPSAVTTTPVIPMPAPVTNSIATATSSLGNGLDTGLGTGLDTGLGTGSVLAGDTGTGSGGGTSSSG